MSFRRLAVSIAESAGWLSFVRVDTVQAYLRGGKSVVVPNLASSKSVDQSNTNDLLQPIEAVFIQHEDHKRGKQFHPQEQRQARMFVELKRAMIEAVRDRGISTVASELVADFDLLQSFQEALNSTEPLEDAAQATLRQLEKEALQLEEREFYRQMFDDPAELTDTCAANSTRIVSWRPIGTPPAPPV